jgi:hypothetical protein
MHVIVRIYHGRSAERQSDTGPTGNEFRMQNTIIIIIIIIIIIMAVEVDLKATQREIPSARDRALLTKYRATKILQTATASKCARCQQFEEKICYFITACPVLSKEQHIKRHD